MLFRSLDGARRIFLRDGFDGASMNDIVRAAGVSKGTLYVYFPSKEALFAALIRHDKRQQAERMCAWACDSTDVREALRRVGRSFLEMMSRADHMAQVRTVIAVAPRFPEIGRAFYEAGPQYGFTRLEGLLTRYVQSGDLVIDNLRRAAIQFVQLCKGEANLRLFFGQGDEPTEEEVVETIDSAVDFFLCAYGAPGRTRPER